MPENVKQNEREKAECWGGERQKKKGRRMRQEGRETVASEGKWTEREVGGR